MKKIFAAIMAVAMIATMFVFTASAADNEWAVYASANAYKEEYDEDDEELYEEESYSSPSYYDKPSERRETVSSSSSRYKKNG